MGSDELYWTAEDGFRWFQFTLPHGERLLRLNAPFRIRQFQFTLPHGERHGAIYGDLHRPGFNSRSRMGSDTRPTTTAATSPGFNSRSRMGSDAPAD